MVTKQKDCIFCNIPREDILFEDDYSVVIPDKFPVTPLHSLVIPKRHVLDYFELSDGELLSVNNNLRALRESILGSDNAVQGFNIGVNSGAVAGQTVFHCHIHLIPRRAGDVDNPRGGVRHLIPGKGGILN